MRFYCSVLQVRVSALNYTFLILRYVTHALKINGPFTGVLGKLNAIPLDPCRHVQITPLSKTRCSLQTFKRVLILFRLTFI
jgi:hypothetical protein